MNRYGGGCFVDAGGGEPEHQELFLNCGLKVMENADSTDKAALFGYWKEMIKHYQQQPADNLLSSLIHSMVSGVPLTEDKLLAFCSILLVRAARRRCICLVMRCGSLSIIPKRNSSCGGIRCCT